MGSISQYGYIRAVGDPDYNFANSNFTIEFFIEPNSNSGIQTLFEITNNESSAAENYSRSRFIGVIENGNANIFGLQIVGTSPVLANSNTFISPINVNANNRISYNGILLSSSQYTISNNGYGNVITMNGVILSPVNTVAEINQILFNAQGGSISSGNSHFISIERSSNDLYLFIDGQLQNNSFNISVPVPNQYLTNLNNNSIVLNRVNAPSLLTIGANQYGENPFFGKFGDFKIIKGYAEHINPSTNVLQSPNSPLLGVGPSNVIVEGGGFIDTFSGFTPEELVKSQIFDTLKMTVYQINDSSIPYANNNPVLTYAMFKSMIDIGPVQSISFNTGPNANFIFTIPWPDFHSGDLSVMINGTPISTNEWYINGGKIHITNSVPDANLSIFATGPTNYYAIGDNTISNLSANLSQTDSNIYVSNISIFPVPSINSNGATIRGQICIENELITYLYVDTANSALSGLIRGVSGTSNENFYPMGTQVINCSQDVNLLNATGIDPSTKVWYSAPFNNTSLQNTNSTISSILVSYGGIIPNGNLV